MAARIRAERPDAAPDAQVHLGPRRPRGVNLLLPLTSSFPTSGRERTAAKLCFATRFAREGRLTTRGDLCERDVRGGHAPDQRSGARTEISSRPPTGSPPARL